MQNPGHQRLVSGIQKIEYFGELIVAFCRLLLQIALADCSCRQLLCYALVDANAIEVKPGPTRQAFIRTGFLRNHHRVIRH